MKKITIVFFTMVAAVFLQLSGTAMASPVKNIPVLEKIQKQQKRLIEKEKIEELTEQGYTKKEIFMGAIIARKSNKSIDEVLALYQKTKSWEITAKELGVDIRDLQKIESLQKWKKLVESNSAAVISYLAQYSDKSENDIKDYLKDGVPLRFLVSAAAMSKLSGREMDEIISYKQEEMSHHDILKILEISEEKLHKELEQLRKNIEDNINETK